jgi:hypothetical protein
MTSHPLKRVIFRLAKQKKRVIFRLVGGHAICNLLEVQQFFSVVGVRHFDGRYYFPKNGRKFLEAIYDYYFLKLNGLTYPRDNPKNHLSNRRFNIL